MENQVSRSAQRLNYDTKFGSLLHGALTYEIVIVYIGVGQKDRFINQSPITLHGFELQVQEVFEHVPHEFKRTAVKDATKRLHKCMENTGSFLETLFI